MTRILDLLKLTKEIKRNGVWLSGIQGEGEYKQWFVNGKLSEHSNWKNGGRHGEYKGRYNNGQLWENSLWKNGDRNGEFKQWLHNGELAIHYLYKNGILIKDYLND